MKFKLFILLLFIPFYTRQVVAQNSYDLFKVDVDTIFVDSNRKGVSNEVSVATKNSSISKEILSQAAIKSLADLLTENSMIYIKSYGDGALATSSFRGTNSSHTAVTWNGIKINPVMSTGFDYSQFPAFFIDDASLSHGSTDLSGGSGALGGNVSLINEITNETPPVSFFAEMGSFDTYSVGAAVKYGNIDKTSFRTRIYYKESDNDFRYLNKVYGINQFYENREESSYKIGGFMQEIYAKLPKNATLNTSILAIFNDRELPQPIVVNVSKSETQSSGSVKVASTYSLPTKNGEFNATLGYMLDNFSYDLEYATFTAGNKSTYNSANTIIAKVMNNNQLSSKFTLSEALTYSHDIVISDNYSDNINRDVATLLVKGEYLLSERLMADATVMGELNGGKVAATGSVGLNYELSKKIGIKASGGYNNRFPSLNDLYWNPGGNVNLEAENGLSVDLSMLYNTKIGDDIYLKLEGSYYLMNIKNWIVWQPMNGSYIWQPQNLKRVLSHGAELSAEINYLISDKWKAKVAASYTYSSSTNREREFDNDNTYHKQLTYVPLHKTNLRLGVDYGSNYLTWQLYQVGKRYTISDNTRYTDAYVVNDVEVGRFFKVGKNSIKIPVRLKVNNLFNTYWESIEYYPMPLRYYSVNVGVIF